MKKYHISVIGSCVSRDMFNSKFISDYNNFFVVDSYFARTTMPSIVGKPIPYDINILEKEFNHVYFDYHYTECAKQMLTTLCNNQSDYLMLDFYGDAYNGTYEYEDTYIKGALGELRKSAAIDTNKIGKQYNYANSPDEYFDIWCKSFDAFMDYARSFFPSTIIFVNGILGNNKITETIDGKVVGIQQPTLNLAKLNEFWERLNRYCEEKHGIPVLRYEKEYTLDPNYLYGLKKQFVHFHQNYYDDAFKKIIAFCKTNKPKKHSVPNINLVRNGDFSSGKSYWDFENGEWEIKQQGQQMVVAPRGMSATKWNGCWSEPIEINADGSTKYKLSFDIIYSGKRIRGTLPVMGIRMFKRAKEKTFIKCIDAEIVEIPVLGLKRNKLFHHSYTFQPKGKFIRIAPHVKGDMTDITFTNIQLQKIL